MEPATLIICADATDRRNYKEWVRLDGYRVMEAASVSEAVACHRRGVLPLTIADLTSPSLDGVHLINAVRESAPLAEFLMVSAPDSVTAAFDAFKAGAADVLLKPVLRETFLESVRMVHGSAAGQHRSQAAPLINSNEIVARSEQMLNVLALVGRVAARDTTVLITGESGTGKELIARAIHQNSSHATRPMVSINCAAIPEALVESELFGYCKGAFTGADANKPGLFATASGGTVFLDEIAELSLSTQAKLLRFIQQGTYYPLGSVSPCTANVRLISATNSPLLARVDAGTFRRDLYYRLSVFPIHIPPLRQRPSDILPLAEHFLRQVEVEAGRVVPGLSREVTHYLTARSWCGNARELQSAIERAVIMSDGSLLTSTDFRRLAWGPSPGVDLGELPEDGVDLEALNRRLIARALDRTQYNVCGAARLLGLSRPTLRSRMKRYKLKPPTAPTGLDGSLRPSPFEV